MRTWVRAESATICGGVAPSGKACPHLIAKGDAMLLLTLPGLDRRKVRCATCAGEPVPADLPPFVERPNRMQPMVHIRTGADALPFDFKARAAGEREPGEDG